MPGLMRAILFDADGVIVNPMMQFSVYLAHIYGITPEKTHNFFDETFDQCLLGRARLEDVLPPFLSEWGWPGSVDDFIATWMREDNHVDARLVQAIQRLRGEGYLCCLATLQECHRAEYMRREMGFEHIFDRLFFSCDLGCMKPDPEFYAKIEQQLGLSGKALMFWDDKPWNVHAARLRHWHAEVYISYETFERHFWPI